MALRPPGRVSMTASVSRACLSLIAVLLPVALVGCGAESSPSRVQTVTIEFWGADDAQPGPDGQRHDFARPTMVHIDYPATLALKVVNHDRKRHALRAPALGLDAVAEPSDGSAPKVAFFSVSVPGRGTYRWYCYVPCDQEAGGWAMQVGPRGPARDDFMAGYFHVA